MRKKILLIRTSSLGDVIFNTPLANRLKFNDYHVTWLVGEKGIDIIKNNPVVDDVVFVPIQSWKKENIFKILKQYISIIKYLRKQKFDICLDMQGLLFKSAIFMLLSGAKRRIIAQKTKEFSFLCANEIIPESFFNNEQHIIKRNLLHADYLKLADCPIKYSLPIPSEEDIEKINYLLKNIDKNKKTIAICPATTWIGKHWNKDYWVELIEKFNNDYNLIFTGTNNDLDLINYINKNKQGINIAGKTNIRELIALFNRVDLTISLDSGSTHLARATEKTKLISIFCCTPTEIFSPITEPNKYEIVANTTCSPCMKRKCKLHSEPYKCTFSPSVEDVYNKVKSMI